MASFSYSQRLLALITAFLITMLTACGGGGGSGGDVTVITPENNAPSRTPKTFTVNNADGGAGLQAALDAAQAGDTVIIRAGSNSYDTDYRFPGELLRGFTLANSGTATDPIRIIGEAVGSALRPVIDQGKSTVHDPNTIGALAEPTAGLYLLCASHVIIDNVEIRNVHLAGITTSTGACESENIRIENSHIHHVYGDRYVAAIRLSRASDVVVSNNDLHDVYQVDSARVVPIITGTHHHVANIHIEHNQFTNLNTGIRMQAQHDKSIEDVTIRANHMEGLDSAITALVNKLNTTTPATAYISAINILDNLIMSGAEGVAIDTGESQSQSSGLNIANNTFYQLNNAPIQTSGVDAVYVYNNIFSHITRDLMITTAPVNNALVNSVWEYDYNLYWHTAYSAATGPEWLLDVGGADPQVFASFNLWQQAYSDTLHAQLQSDPDQASQFANPQFNDAANGDFRPNLAFTQTGGRNGGPLGAFRDGEPHPGLQ